MPNTAPAYTIGGITRPEIFFDANGNIVLTPEAAAFANTYGVKALYFGLPFNTPYPPVADSVSAPVDANAAPNSVAEGAAVNTPVNLTVSSTSTAGMTVTYSLTADSSGGGFKIDPLTGVVTVADPSKIDFETAPGHAYSVTAQANDGIITSSQTFSIGVTDVAPSTPTDSNLATNTVAEGAAIGTTVGVTAASTDINGPGVTWSLTTDSSHGGFKIDPTTGVITVADPSKIDFESSAASGHTYSVTAIASDGTLSNSTTFTIAVTDVSPPAPTDINNAANSVAEGAANGTTVGITASSVDPNGPPTTYSLADNAGGRFAIDPATGVVTVANGAAIDFEGPAGHAYSITVQAVSGASTTSSTFSIGVTDVAPSPPADSNGAPDTVFEGAANGSTVGITAASTDPGGNPAATFALTDDAGGLFTINSTTGVVTVADGAGIDFENAPGPGHSYSITVQATAGALSSTHTFSIAVGDVNEAPQGTDKTVVILEDGSHNFTVADFGFSDPSDSVNPNSLLAVKMTTVPNAGAGTFTDNGVTVNAGDSVSASDIAAGLLKFTPVHDANGSPEASFTFQVQDNGGTANGGHDLDQSANTFTINVNAVNDAPIVLVPGSPTVNEDATLTFSSVNGNAITISDVDVGSGNETVTLTVANGTLALGSHTGLVSFTPDNAASITLTGSIVDIDNALNGLTYSGNANFNGTDTLQIVANDNGNTGAGGPQFANGEVTINVASVNDAPAGTDNTLTTLEDTSYTFTAADFGFTDPLDVTSNSGANAFQDVIFTTVPGAAGTLTDNGSTLVAGNFVTINDINAGLLKFNPTANANGTPEASFTFQVQDDGGGADTDLSPNTITFNVTSVNDAPAGADKILAVQGAHTFVAADFGFTDPLDTPANALKAVEITTLQTTGTLTDNGIQVTAGQFVSAADINGGHLVFTPTGNANASFTFQVQDDGGTLNSGVDTDQSPNTLTITQDPPPVANDDSVTATEAGGLNNGIPGHDPSGNVILGTGGNGEVADTDPDVGDTLIVVAAGTGTETAPTGAGTVNTAFNGLHGSLLIHTDGSYTYTVDQSDALVQGLHTSADTLTDSFNYTIEDNGHLQDTATLTVTIHGADDLPQAVADTGSMFEDDAPTLFNVIANDTQDPDSTATNAITVGPGSITVTGPGGETFVNTDATASIVSNQVQVTLNNAHFQQLAVGEHATVTVPYTLTGDTLETSSANLVVTVFGENDPVIARDDTSTMTEDQVQSFAVLGNDTLDVDHTAPNTITTGTVTAVGNGAASTEGIDASDVTVTVTGVAGAQQIQITLGADFQHLQEGQTATIDVPYTLQGDQTDDTSTATLEVTVTGVNDAPTVSNVTFSGAASANYNTDLVVNDPTDAAPTVTGPFKGITGSLLSLSNAHDVDGPNALSFVPGTITTADGGHVVLQADGDFVFKPAAGDTHTSDSFTFTVTDGNSPTAGTASATATINFNGPHIWYVNADAAAGGDGTSENPFNDFSHFANTGVGNNVDHAGDTIFLETSTAHYTGALTLENNEQLISQSAGLVVPDGSGTPGQNVTLQTAGGANAVIDGNVVLGTGNNIQGVDFGNATGFSLSGTSVGTVHVDDVTHGVVNNTSGGGVSIAGTSNVLNMDFTSFSTGAGANGIALAGSSGTFHVHGGTISGASGADVSLNGGTVNFTDEGAIVDPSGTVVSISNMTGGTQSFTGAIGTTAATDGSISLSTNTNNTVSFSGGMALSTGASAAFSASNATAVNAGTVNITGTNHLTTTTGTALNVTDTNIGSSNLTFQDISSVGGASDGIILVNTGTAAGNGGLHVTGTGTTAGSGGTISGKTGAAADGSTTQGTGIELNGTKDVQLNDMNLHDFSNFAINGNNVTGFKLDHSTINGNNGDSNSAVDPLTTGTNVGEDAVRLTNLFGTDSITNSSISGGYTDTLLVENTSGTLTMLTVDNSTIGGRTDNGTGMNDGINFQADTGSTAMNLTVTNSKLTDARANLLATTGDAGSTIGVTFDNNTVTNDHPQVVSGGGGIDIASQGNVNYDISNNSFDMHAADGGTGIRTNVITVFKGDGSTGNFDGTIAGNTIGVDGVAHSGSGTGADDIHVESQGTGTSTVLIKNNTVLQYDEAGIVLENVSGSSTLNATVIGNTATELNTTGNAFAGLWVVAGSGDPGDTGTVNVKIGGAGAEQFNDCRTYGRIRMTRRPRISCLLPIQTAMPETQGRLRIDRSGYGGPGQQRQSRRPISSRERCRAVTTVAASAAAGGAGRRAGLFAYAG